jgi:hypothetical protein
MARVVIRNDAEPQWQEVMDSKLQIMLGSMFGDISRIEILLDKVADQRLGQSVYNCTLLVRESSGQKHTLHNQQPDANLAIEGAIARARRAVTRLSRARNTSWGPATVQNISQRSSSQKSSSQ